MITDKPNVPLTNSYDEIVKNLGCIVPCYAENNGGCCADDPTNEIHCNDESDDGGCLMLRIYKAGYRAALADNERK